MPVEGQWERANTPLGRRDKWLLTALVVLAVVVAASFGGYYALRSSPSADRGCLVTTVASTMGGASLKICGAAAHAYCRSQGPLSRTIAAACRRRGFAADVEAGAR